MEDKQFQTLQKIVVEYFKDVSDDDFVLIVDAFVYDIITDKTKNISGTLTAFLKANGLETAYTNYISDFVRKESTFFRKSMGSESTIIDGIRMALLNESYNRLRKRVGDVIIDKKQKAEYVELKRIVSQLMDAGTTERYHEALDELKEIYLNWVEK